jgi:hypothetical protein
MEPLTPRDVENLSASGNGPGNGGGDVHAGEGRVGEGEERDEGGDGLHVGRSWFGV